MDDEQIKKIIEDVYDDSKREGLMSMARDFFNRKMLSLIIFIWMWTIVFIVGAVFSAIQFFKTDQAKFQIMYAAIFVSLVQCMSMMKVFAWQMIHRNNIKREIKRLELTIAELSQMVKNE